MPNKEIEVSKVIESIRVEYGSGRDLIKNSLNRLYGFFREYDDTEAHRKVLADLCKERKIKVQRNSDFASILTRLTIAEDRKKAHPYTAVIRKAAKEAVSPDDFLDWLEKSGGIECVRLGKSAKGASMIADEKERTKKAGEEYLARLEKKADLPLDKNIEFEGRYAIFLVRRDGGEEARVVDVYDANNVNTKAVIQQLGKKALKEIEDAAESTKLAA